MHVRLTMGRSVMACFTCQLGEAMGARRFSKTSLDIAGKVFFFFFKIRLSFKSVDLE